METETIEINFCDDDLVFFMVNDPSFFDGIYYIQGGHTPEEYAKIEKFFEWFPCMTLMESTPTAISRPFEFPIELLRVTLQNIGEELYYDNDQKVFKTRRRPAEDC